MHEDWKEFLELLLKHNVEFIVAGAHAMSAHGYSRQTGDIDIWINPTDNNGYAALNVLREFGMGSLGLDLNDMKGPNVIQLGVEPLRIDLLKEVDGVTFDQAYANVRRVQTEGMTLPIMSKQDLIKNKLATNRPKDIADVQMLRKLSPPKSRGKETGLSM